MDPERELGVVLSVWVRACQHASQGITVNYFDADESWVRWIAEEWGQVVARHVHLADGFTLLALADGAPAGIAPAGLISVYWRELPPPLEGLIEGYIDILEVVAGLRRRGIGTRLVELSAERARAHGAVQVRAWSSEDKVEAIPFWRALGFGLCPATTYPRGQAVRGYFVTRVLR